jgi:hypothetical protein
MKFPIAGYLIGFCALVITTATGNAASAQDDGTFSLLFDNDWFNNHDRHYTSGLQLAWTTAPDSTPRWLVNTAHALPLFAEDGEVRATYAVTQTMYTPVDIRTATPSLTDRPYAGHLYASLALTNRTERRMDHIQLQLGVVGPSALADDVQDWTHGIFGGRQPAGWHEQLHDEPIVQLFYQRSYKLIPPRRVAGMMFDLQPHIGVAVGNAFDYINAGAQARIGFNLPDDFGPARIPPGPLGEYGYRPHAGFGAYLFAGVDGRAVARNIFLDGNTWRGSRSVDKKILVGDVQLGAALVFNGIRLTYTNVIRSKEFKTQAKYDSYGAVNISVRF